MLARWQSRRYKPLLPHKKKQLDSYPRTKIALGGLKVQLSTYSNITEQTVLNSNTEKDQWGDWLSKDI